MKRLLTQILPFIVALSVGVLIYLYAQNMVKDEGLNDLVINIAAGLISIPLVFISYEVINKITSRNLHNSLFESIALDVNTLLIDLFSKIQLLLNLPPAMTEDSLAAFLEMDATDFDEKLKLKLDAAPDFLQIKRQLVSIVHKPSSFEILSERQTFALLNISKELLWLSHNLDLGKKNLRKYKKAIVKNLLTIQENLFTWVESGERESLENHARFGLTLSQK